MTRHELREACFRIVFQFPFYREGDLTDQEDEFLEELAGEPELFLSDASMKREPPVTEEDITYIRIKITGLRNHLDEIDAAIGRNSNGWKLKRIGKSELAILRLAVYEMLYDDDIPIKVAIDEAVELSKEFADEKASSFVNGILSSVLSEQES